MDLGLKHRVALVTGAGRGIGRAIALRLAGEGAQLAINDIDVGLAGRTVDELRGRSAKAEAFVADVTNLAAVKEMVAQVESQFGRLDVLINNAGISIAAPFHQMTAEQWQKVMDVNLNGVFYCTSAAFPVMMKNQYGRIISVGSYAGKRGALLGGNVSYCVSKAGVHGLTISLVPEASRYNITVNAVAPGFVETDMLLTRPAEQRRQLAESAWLKRLASVEDVAGVVAFLASEAAGYITGEIVDVNGGLYLDV